MKNNNPRDINGNVFIASDCHFGVPSRKESAVREQLFIQWLDSIKSSADYLILLGDIFDFWFEYKHVVPKGHTRLLGKFAELSDRGIKIIYFTGNHDFWVRTYFQEELNFEIIRTPQVFYINGKKVFIGHGDGIGPKDSSYKIMKYIFEAPINRWFYSRLHPNFAFWLALKVSSKSRAANGNTDEIFHGDDKERLIVFARKLIKTGHYDYFIFGHRHLALSVDITPNSKYINTGEWIKTFSYAQTEGDQIVLKMFKNNKNQQLG
jgi:UDP-2,3-diacylglucosamine hydrolase